MQQLDLTYSDNPLENAIFKSPLEDSERSVLLELLTQGERSISLSINDQITSTELVQYLDIAGRAHRRLGGALSVLQPLIGQMLLLVKAKPELFKEMGFSNFDSFLKEGATKMLGVGKSTLYSCIRIAKAFPSLEIDRFERIGSTKAEIIARVTSEGNSNCEELLKLAERPEVTAEMLRDHLSEKGLAESSQLKCAVLKIPCEEALRQEFDEMLCDPLIINGLDIRTPGQLLQALLADAKASLYQQAREYLGQDQEDESD